MPKRARLAVGAVFLINGLGIATFLPRLPEIQQRLGLSDAGLGAALTGAGLGGLLGSLAAGPIVSRLGSRKATLAAGTVLGVALFPLAIAPSGAVLALALAAVGFADAVTDIAMNAHGMRVQRFYPRPIINGFHAAWSVGAMTGALLGSLAVALTVPLQAQMAVISVLVVCALWVAVAWFLADDPASAVVPGVRPRLRGLGALAVVALGTGIIEGAPADWGAVYLEGDGGARAPPSLGSVTRSSPVPCWSDAWWPTASSIVLGGLSSFALEACSVSPGSSSRSACPPCGV